MQGEHSFSPITGCCSKCGATSPYWASGIHQSPCPGNMGMPRLLQEIKNLDGKQIKTVIELVRMVKAGREIIAPAPNWKFPDDRRTW
jgi:hypothetical protein